MYVQYLVSKTWKALFKKREFWKNVDSDFHVISLHWFNTWRYYYVFSLLIDLAVFIDLTVLLWLRHMLLSSVFTRAGSSSGLIWAQFFLLTGVCKLRYGDSSGSIQLYYFLLFLFFISLALRTLILRASQDISELCTW